MAWQCACLLPAQLEYPDRVQLLDPALRWPPRSIETAVGSENGWMGSHGVLLPLDAECFSLAVFHWIGASADQLLCPAELDRRLPTKRFEEEIRL